MTDFSTGPKVQEGPREVGDSRLVATVTGPEGSVLRLIRDNEVICDG